MASLECGLGLACVFAPMVFPSVAEHGQDGQFRAFWISLRDDELGATMVDYAVLLTLVSLGLVSAISILGNEISAVFQAVASGLGKSQN